MAARAAASGLVSSPVFAAVAAFAAGVVPPAVAAPAVLFISFLPCFVSSYSLWISSRRRLTLSNSSFASAAPLLLLRREQGPRIPLMFPERLLPAAIAPALQAHPLLSLGLGAPTQSPPAAVLPAAWP